MVEVDSRPRGTPPDPARFRGCRRALRARLDATSGTAEESPYRRCPVGVIASADCPEFVGDPCGFHEDRGEEPAPVVPAEEVAALARELSRDFLTAAYRRRLEALRAGRCGPERGAEILVTHPVGAAPAAPVPVAPARLVSPGPVNLSADPGDARGPRSAR